MRIAVISAFTLTVCVGAAPVPLKSSLGEATDYAAAVTLLTLRAHVLPLSDRDVRYALEAAGEPLTLREAAARLAALPKPVQCDASSDDPTVVRVHCRPLRNDRAIAAIQRHSEIIASRLKVAVAECCSELSTNPIVRIEVAAHSVVMRAHDIVTWARDYLVLHEVAIETLDCQRDSEGCAAVVRIERPSKFLIHPDSGDGWILETDSP